MAILFFSEGIDFHLTSPRLTTSWIKKVIKKEQRSLLALNFVFCQDEYLLNLNNEYLKHDTLTDILSFDYSEASNSIDGEIYISIDRVKENSTRFKRSFDEELHRVIIHGVLHLIGYNDKSAADKALMREKEEAYLSLR